jgi:hypothetical protein
MLENIDKIFNNKAETIFYRVGDTCIVTVDAGNRGLYTWSGDSYEHALSTVTKQILADILGISPKVEVKAKEKVEEKAKEVRYGPNNWHIEWSKHD